MKYQLSFGHIALVNERIAELMIDQGTHISLEMCEELDQFLIDYFPSHFALINNRIQDFTMSFEAILHIGSLENLCAAAIITYDETTELFFKKMQENRPQDKLNIKAFSALELGRVKAIDWLTHQLDTLEVE